MATLKEAVSVAKRNAAAERAEREKQEARVAEVRQELQVLMEKHESLELDSKTRASELAVGQICLGRIPEDPPGVGCGEKDSGG